jgi:hypothetical protein
MGINITVHAYKREYIFRFENNSICMFIGSNKWMSAHGNEQQLD